MSIVQHPYDDEGIAYRRAWPSIHDIDFRNVDMRNERDRWLATYDALSARLAKLEAALRFYAEPSGYLPGARAVSVVSMDGGERARAALEEPCKGDSPEAAEEDKS